MADVSELQLKAGLEELSITFQIESIEVAITVSHFEPDIV
jgi:hypothetical protein